MRLYALVLAFTIIAFAGNEYTQTERTLLDCIQEQSFNKRQEIMREYVTHLRKKHGFGKNDLHFSISPLPPEVAGRTYMEGNDILFKKYLPTHITLNQNQLFGLIPEQRRRSCIEAIHTINHELGHAVQKYRLKQQCGMISPDDESNDLSEADHTTNMINMLRCFKNNERHQRNISGHASYPDEIAPGRDVVEVDADMWAIRHIDSPCLLKSALEKRYLHEAQTNQYLTNHEKWKMAARECARNHHRETIYKKPFWEL